MKFAKPILVGVFILALAALGLLLWATAAMGPTPEAFAALRSDAYVTVTADKFIVFQPAKKPPTTAFVFYPGGRVDYRSYAAPLHKIATEGYLVILLPMRLNLALLDVNAADRAIADFPEIRHWIVGGHSLGGVAAGLYAGKHEDIDGLVFWASCPGDDALKNTDMKVLSIYGTLDMNGVGCFDASRANLPDETQFVVIAGGNHAQFGDYGLQSGDGEATLIRSDQQNQAVAATVRFLKERGR